MKVLIWKNDDFDSVYRVDDKKEAERFFRDLTSNAETDGREQFQVMEMTRAEYDECVKNGDDAA